MKKCFLLLTLCLTPKISFANNDVISLKGKQAQELFDSLPQTLRQIRPGSIIKRTLKIVCTAAVVRRPAPLNSCTIEAGKEIRLERGSSEATALYVALPNELASIHPGSTVKTTSGVSCAAFPNHGGPTIYRCEVYK